MSDPLSSDTDSLGDKGEDKNNDKEKILKILQTKSDEKNLKVKMNDDDDDDEEEDDDNSISLKSDIDLNENELENVVDEIGINKEGKNNCLGENLS